MTLLPTCWQLPKSHWTSRLLSHLMTWCARRRCGVCGCCVRVEERKKEYRRRGQGGMCARVMREGRGVSYGRNVALTLALAGAQIGARPNEWDGVAYYTQVVASVAGDMTRRATFCWDGVMKEEVVVVVVVSDVDDIGQHKASRARSGLRGWVWGCGCVPDVPLGVDGTMQDGQARCKEARKSCGESTRV